MELYRRSLRLKLDAALKQSPAVLVTGPRQAGKTTLIKEMGIKYGYSYTNFDDILALASVINDPVGFIANLQKPAILDEVQRANQNVFLTIKKDIDENREPGRYALTGSTDPLLIPQLSDAFVGRMEILNLLPLSVGEILGQDSFFIDTVFKNKLTVDVFSKRTITQRELYSLILKGGYPVIQKCSDAQRNVWFHSYISTIIERDVQELAHIEKLTRLPNLLELLAVRTGSLLNISNLSKDYSDIPRTTIHRYLALFYKLFLVYFCEPWKANLGDRLIKTQKTFFFDTGLAAFLLNLNEERASYNPIMMGNLLENFALAEILRQQAWNETRIKIYYFRTSSNIEVDFVLENGSGSIVGIEVKHSGTVNPSDFNGLRYLQEKTKERFIRGIVLYMGTESIPFGKNFWAVPVNQLWEMGARKN